MIGIARSEDHKSASDGLALDTTVASSAAEAARVLSTPSRLRLLWALREGERNVAELAELTQVSPSAASQQLRVLRLSHFVRTRREGQSIYYRLNDHHVSTLLMELASHAEHVREDSSAMAVDTSVARNRTA